MSDEEKPVSPAAPPSGGDPLPEIAEIPPVEPAEPARHPAFAPEAASVPPAAPPAPARAVESRRGGSAFVAALLGGAMACAAGFALSHYNLFGLRTEPDLAAYDARLAALDKVQAEQKSALAALAPVDDPQEELDSLAARLAALETALAALPEDGGGAGPAALAALQAEVAALKAASGAPADVRAVVQDELAKWQKDASAQAQAEAETARTAALKQAAAATLADAVASGAPYAAALQAMGLDTPPEALVRHAETGLPTHAELAEGFAAAARDALAAAPVADQGIWGFLGQQVGARSLTPQEGTTPDAILSRAEAAVKTGDLAAALAELAALPPESQAAVAPWVADAADRLAAEQALAALPAPNAP